MQGLRRAGAMAAAVVLLSLAGCALFWAQQRTIVCDGLFPQWVLDAQDYEGGGCAEPIPFSQAPADADWTPIWTGYAFCADGQLFLEEECVLWPADQPWPSGAPYP